MLEILQKQHLNPKLEGEISSLFKQLSPNKLQVPISELITDDNKQLIFMVYKVDHSVVGIASMCIYKVISGYKGWIEDVVVNSDFRGRKIGQALIQGLIEKGREIGLTEIFLFTEDEKKAAIRLYQKLGFLQKESKLYHLKTNV